jgi:enoyl-CoA hydratase/carnithine racemase
MILTGSPINADEAFRLNLTNKVLPDWESLLQEAHRLADNIAGKSLLATSFTKRAIKQSLEMGESPGIDHERSLFIGLLKSKDTTEGVTAFIQKRKPVWTDH